MTKTFAERSAPKANATDAAFERETVITWSDADSVIQITTSQRPMITSLKNNPSAKLIETSQDVHIFEIPLGLITVRKGKRTVTNRVVRKGRPVGVKLCGEPTKKGTPCEGIAKLDTGKCAKHS